MNTEDKIKWEIARIAKDYVETDEWIVAEMSVEEIINKVADTIKADEWLDEDDFNDFLNQTTKASDIVAQNEEDAQWARIWDEKANQAALYFAQN